MRHFIAVCILCISCSLVHAQVVTTGKVKYSTDATMGLDSNKLAIDEKGNKLQFYQYSELLKSGQYGISTRSSNGLPADEYRLVRKDAQQNLKLYELVKKQIAIPSTMLEEGTKLSVQPLRTIDPSKFDNKAIVLMFLSPDCQQCMVDMPDLSNFLKRVDPNKMVLVALARGDESPERMQFLRSLLPNAHIFINYNSISEAYWVGDLTTGYVIADKDHIIRFTSRGQGGIIPGVFKSKLTEVLK